MLCSLHAKTQELWRNRPRHQTIMKTHMETGIPFFWLEHWSKGRCKIPPVDYIETLYTHLSGKSLDLVD